MDTEHYHHRRQEFDDPITGPHAGYDRFGRLDHVYWRCERCGLESTDGSLRDGCWRCTDARGTNVAQ